MKRNQRLLLIAMIIIGLWVGYIAPKLILNGGPYNHIYAKGDIELFSMALDRYKHDTGRYPTQESGLNALITHPQGVEGWMGPYLHKKVIPKDPWGAEYVYKYPGKHGDYDIISYGADASNGGEGECADIVSWE